MKTKESDYVKAVKRADREFEIEEYGKLISTRPTKIHNSKKKYNRSKFKNNIDY